MKCRTSVYISPAPNVTSNGAALMIWQQWETKNGLSIDTTMHHFSMVSSVLCWVKGWMSAHCVVPDGHPVAHIENPITYKGIRKVVPAESIYPIPIVVWTTKTLRAALFHLLLFKTTQWLFGIPCCFTTCWVYCEREETFRKNVFLKPHVFNNISLK